MRAGLKKVFEPKTSGTMIGATLRLRVLGAGSD